MTEQQTGQESVEEQQNQQNEQGQESGNEEQATGQQPQGGEQGNDAGWLARELEKTRREAAKYRTERNEQNQQFDTFKQQMAKALGIQTGDEPDPEALSSELQNTRSELKRLKIRDAFSRAANKHGADQELAYAHLFASGAFDGLDTEAEDFGSQVEQSLQTALESYPKLKADYQPQGTNVGGSGSNPANGSGNDPDKNPWSDEHFNLMEQGVIYRKDPEKAKRLANAAGKSL